MIPEQLPPKPSAIQMLQSIRPDWTFGQMDKRVTLNFGGKRIEPDNPDYDLIKKLILQKYVTPDIYGH